MKITEIFWYGASSLYLPERDKITEDGVGINVVLNYIF